MGTTFSLICIVYLHLAQQTCCLYLVSRALSLKWKPRHIEMRFPLLIAGMLEFVLTDSLHLHQHPRHFS